MDWSLAIRRNRDALRQIVAELFVLAGVRPGGPLVWLPRPVHLIILLVLRPAESAVRRLIVIAAHGLALKPRAVRTVTMAGDQPAHWLNPTGHPARRAFALFDPLKPFDIAAIWGEPDDNDDACADGDAEGWPAAEPAPSRMTSARLIGLRLNALLQALEDLPRQARRLARWRARRDLARKAGGPWRPGRLSPIRPGPAPGRRLRPIHAIDAVLKECHLLAINLPGPADTS